MSASKAIPSRTFPRRARQALLALPLLAASGAPAQALTVFCANDAQELHDNLVSALTAPGEVLVKVRGGTFNMADVANGGTFALNQTLSSQKITISGGWGGVLDACTFKFYGSDNTVLTGLANRTALYVNTGPMQTGNEIVVEDLALHNPNYTAVGNGACLQASTNTSNKLTLERLRMEQCNAANSSSAAANLNNDGGELWMRDVVAANNQGNYSGGIGIDTSQNGITRLSHLSVTTSSATNAGAIVSGIYLANFNNATTWLSNSVTWGNDSDPATRDLSIAGAQIHLIRVHYGKLGGSVPAENVTPGSGDPGFVAVGDPRPRADSILVDSGVANPEGGSGNYDADGATRVKGAAVDVGAFESDVIFQDGFE